MGFSLKAFFEELEDMLDSDDYDRDEFRIEAIKQLVADRKVYAAECGQL